ncbi:hypothetical protein AVEN_116887-1 [Araneus ventricosus]|uniref:Uncharacterized protein n=1 Tax=Araneus ventricosus TaxID=182803 RepID=A0A4Y2QIF5_ARAVE|nr:hypothetical protein AVEN_116887-1 [Araneus ventricosus]
MPGSKLLKQKYKYSDVCFTSAVNCVNPTPPMTEQLTAVHENDVFKEIISPNFIKRVRKPLAPPYDGPSPVVKRRHFTVTIKGKDINIAIDRLKPAYLLLTEVVAPHHKKLDTVPTLPNEN